MTSRRESLGGAGARASSGLVRRESEIARADYRVHITLQRAPEILEERENRFGIVRRF
ncbi:MAG: hypothetical protein ACM3ZB_06110 [bacterium]